MGTATLQITLPSPVPPHVGILARLALTFASAVLVGIFGILTCSGNLLLLVQGIAISLIWQTYLVAEEKDEQPLEEIVRAVSTADAPLAAAPGAQTEDSANSESGQEPTAPHVELPNTTCAPDDDSDQTQYELLFEGEQAFPFPFEVVQEAFFTMHDELPNSVLPELLRVEVGEDAVHVPSGYRVRQRLFVSKPSIPAALQALTDGDTSSMEEFSVSKQAERELLTVTRNVDNRKIARGKMWQRFSPDPRNPSGSTIRREHFWAAVPGLFWPLSTTALSFSKSEIKSKGKLSTQVLLERCAVVAAAASSAAEDDEAATEAGAAEEAGEVATPEQEEESGDGEEDV